MNSDPKGVGLFRRQLFKSGGRDCCDFFGNHQIEDLACEMTQAHLVGA